MRPRGVPSKWVKVRPWHFTARRVPARQQELRDALVAEDNATTARMGTLALGGTGRVDRLVRAALSSDPWATDARHIGGDFARALERVERDNGGRHNLRDVAAELDIDTDGPARP